MVLPIEAQPPSPALRTRRALLGAGLGALAATVAAALGRPAAVHAEGETMTVGGDFDTATSVTTLRNQANGDTVFWAESSSSGYGVYGSSNSSTGVQGLSISGFGVAGYSAAADQPAIFGKNSGDSTGVFGWSGTGAFPAAKAKTGVYGLATQDSASRGVLGRANAGQGVRGEATSGAGVYATASSGYALRTSGRLRVDKVSGVAIIAAGNTAAVVSPGVNVTTSSFVLLTAKANIGSRALWFTTDAAANTFTIRMNSTRSSVTAVAWLLIG